MIAKVKKRNETDNEKPNTMTSGVALVEAFAALRRVRQLNDDNGGGADARAAASASLLAALKDLSSASLIAGIDERVGAPNELATYLSALCEGAFARLLCFFVLCARSCDRLSVALCRRARFTSSAGRTWNRAPKLKNKRSQHST